MHAEFWFEKSFWKETDCVHGTLSQETLEKQGTKIRI
jgi:hypothetical protein